MGWRVQKWIDAFHALEGFLMRHRRIIQTVLACMMVPTFVLLALDARLPFPPPSERPLYSPRGWPGSWSLLISPGQDAARAELSAPESAVGGGTYSLPPLYFMSYQVKRGDTLEKIASRFGMELDTISSLNRPGGRGVHILPVGEWIKIPNQDGIYIWVKDTLDSLCAKYDLSTDQVLAVNSLTREGISTGAQVFFPGAKHEGYALSMAYGVAIASPLRGAWLSSPFGRREDPFTGAPSSHRGIDLAIGEGTIVRSATDGWVTFAGYNDILGNYVQIKAPLGFRYVYGHFSEILVKAGASVSQGTPIGRVGQTGHATGPHLHFEVWKDGIPQNPLRYLP